MGKTPHAALLDVKRGTSSSAERVAGRSWVRDLTEEGIEPHPGPGSGGGGQAAAAAASSSRTCNFTRQELNEKQKAARARLPVGTKKQKWGEFLSAAELRLIDGSCEWDKCPLKDIALHRDGQEKAEASGGYGKAGGRSVGKKNWKPPGPKDTANVRLVPDIAENEPKTFVGASSWLPATVKWVKKRLQENDDVDLAGPRVSPGVLSRFAGGGKTRALIELGKELQKELPDCLVIFISLNDKTRYEGGSSGMSGVEEVVMRIAWVLLGCWVDREKKQATFTAFCKEQMWKKEAFEEWLGSRKAILLVDELNQLPLTSKMGDDNLPSFLSKNFVAPEGRALIFSTHVASTAPTLDELMHKRVCAFLGLPLIESFEEDTKAFGKLWNASKILYYGRSPGLVVTSEQEVLEKFRERFEALKRKESQKALRGVIETALKGGRTEEIGSLEGLADVRVTSNRSTSLLWPPCYLSQVVKKIEGLERAANLLDMLRDGQTNDGKAWEGLVAAAIAMRLWLSRGTVLLPSLERTKIGCIILDDDAQSTTVADVLNRHASSLKSADGMTKTHLIVSWDGQFVRVDVLLVKKGRKEKEREVWGYRCKQGEGEGVPERQPPEGLDRAIWLPGGCAHQESLTTFSKGWEIPSEKRIEELLGVSCSEVVSPYWRARLLQSKPASAAAVGSSAASSAGADSGGGGGEKGKRKKGKPGDASASASSSAGADSGGGGGEKGDRKRQVEHGGDDADMLTQGEKRRRRTPPATNRPRKDPLSSGGAGRHSSSEPEKKVRKEMAARSATASFGEGKERKLGAGVWNASQAKSRGRGK
uniref:Uncharacterized protein n=1 Tax=Chromera velia CCMP2878 TaxID=1169474 RepID=A0A0G4HIV2_9ALVE|eukprot:Cvel_7009.t1-p1 / transcript=Cvel_7009.t1 / gene=Cvel_7009 / organism=Chromera_velia_CCMP2878 / gene_product=hypothetical protein / transcript_product=hypothetical protein / location=Cvel_scaffold357:6629-12104(+) / protein_length=817 / sequence_SO=supercontig / SO=protein_coding / is_pseudo=false